MKAFQYHKQLNGLPTVHLSHSSGVVYPPHLFPLSTFAVWFRIVSRAELIV